LAEPRKNRGRNRRKRDNPHKTVCPGQGRQRLWKHNWSICLQDGEAYRRKVEGKRTASTRSADLPPRGKNFSMILGKGGSSIIRNTIVKKRGTAWGRRGKKAGEEAGQRRIGEGK